MSLGCFLGQGRPCQACSSLQLRLSACLPQAWSHQLLGSSVTPQRRKISPSSRDWCHWASTPLALTWHSLAKLPTAWESSPVTHTDSSLPTPPIPPSRSRGFPGSHQPCLGQWPRSSYLLASLMPLPGFLTQRPVRGLVPTFSPPVGMFPYCCLPAIV